MHKLLASVILVVATIVLTTVGCKKSSTSRAPEQDLLISIDAGSYTIITAPIFNFKVKVESTMPPGGVKIETTVVSEIDNQNYPQGAAINTYNPISSIVIGGLPEQKICVCTIKVTSLTKATNTATTGFRVGYK
jgi:hypothetical protein